jgi:CheY-like chemotaxis protein
MPRVMVSDPHPAVRQTLVLMVARLGYEPVLVGEESPTPARLRSADVLLVEPSTSAGRRLARTARAANPSVAILSQGAPEGIERLGLIPTAHLSTPFTLEQLGVALSHALEQEPQRG